MNNHHAVILTDEPIGTAMQFEAYLKSLESNKGNNTFKVCYYQSKRILKDDDYIEFLG